MKEKEKGWKRRRRRRRMGDRGGTEGEREK
jgi:hypothetical protein